MPVGVTRILASIALLAALAGCSKQPASQQDLDSLDKELTQGNAAGRDPALTASLADQIMVDPALTQGSNANAVRPPNRPDPRAVPPADIARTDDRVDPKTLRKAPAPTADCPECRARDGAMTLGALAGRQGSQGSCAAKVAYSAGWANRLPAAIPLYPDARVLEAAGASRDGCALRVVTFASTAPLDRVLDWYYTRATAGGYSAEHKVDGKQHVLAGTRGDAAYVVYASPRAGGGTQVDLVANAGT